MISFETKFSQSGPQLKDIEKAFRALSKKRLLIGVMDEGRSDKKGVKAGPLTNSQIAFIAEYGCPEKGIPERAFLFPILRRNNAYIKNMLLKAAMAALHGNNERVDQTLTALGIKLVSDMRKYIQAGIAPPLSKNTLRKWVSLKLGKRGKPLSTSKRRSDYGETPYSVTGQFLASLGFSIENRK